MTNQPKLNWSYEPTNYAYTQPEGFPNVWACSAGYTDGGTPEYELHFKGWGCLVFHVDPLDGTTLCGAAKAEQDAVRTYEKKPVNWSETDWSDFRAVAADFVKAVKEA